MKTGPWPKQGKLLPFIKKLSLADYWKDSDTGEKRIYID
jgi:hypothetical protein